MGSCFTGVCGHKTRCDFVVMGSETNMAARLMGKAPIGSILASERVYNDTKDYIGYDVTAPIELKGRDGITRGFKPFGKKAGAVRHKSNDMFRGDVFVGRQVEMKLLRKGLQDMLENSKGSAYILKGVVWVKVQLYGNSKGTSCKKCSIFDGHRLCN